MVTTPATNWHEANQRYLMAAIASVRATLDRAAGREDALGLEVAQAAVREAAAGLPAPAALDRLVAALGLSPFERDVLLLCAGVELSSAFAEALAGPAGNGRMHPTFGLALSVLPEAHWSALSPGSPLRRWRLIEPAPGETLAESRLRLDEWALHYVTGVARLDARLEGLLEPVVAPAAIAPSHLARARRLAERLAAADDAPHSKVQLRGPQPAELRAVAAAASAALGLTLYVLNAADVPAAASEREAMARLWEREAGLGDALLLIEVDDTDASRSPRAFIESARCPLLVAGRETVQDVRCPLTQIDVDRPSSAEMHDLWQAALPNVPVDGQTLERLVSQFRLSAQDIEAIGASERHLPALPSSSERAARLWEACRAHARPRLQHLAQRIVPAATWQDLVLPEQQLETLRDIAAHVRHRRTVYETWRFEQKSERGLGISALFSGPSGTGKTMASEVLANELDLDLYRIDLSQVVSKYIGETEKNLRRVFDAAEAGGAILLFDEADALFGKRTEVKDSHDRYANIEVSYLLQRMEAYRGLAVLTTNMKSALDAAFLRRLRFVVQFPFPEPAQRAEIWKRVFPSQTPTRDIDPERLARLNVAGGNIRNIAMHAAFLAADANSSVEMRHLLRAARAEYAKLERPLTDAEVGGWVA